MDIIETLKQTLETQKISVRRFAESTGIPMDRVYKWLQGKGTPKSEDTLAITRWLQSEKVPNGILEEQKFEYTTNYSKAATATDHNDPPKDMLERLIQSNFLLAQAANTKAEADKVKAETDKINAEATLRMVSNAERLTELVQSDLNVGKETEQAAFAIRAELLELQARLNTKDGLSSTLEEARAKVNTAFFEMKKETKEDHSGSGAHKSGKKSLA